jgi:uncharacterized protein YceH (UPF0502 family)
MITVKDNPSLKRDERSNSILNTDIEEMRKFKQMREENTKVHSLSSEVTDLKSEISELKNLLRQVLSK